MALGEDGFLYVLATDQIVKVDIDRKEVTGSYHFWSDEMTAMVDAVYSVDENGFYLLSCDGFEEFEV